MIMNQIKAVLIKKFAFTKRSPILFVVMMIMPVIFVSIAVLAVNNLRTKHDLPSLEMELTGYGSTVTLIEAGASESMFVMNYIDLVQSKDRRNDVKVIVSGIEDYILDIVSSDCFSNRFHS